MKNLKTKTKLLIGGAVVLLICGFFMRRLFLVLLIAILIYAGYKLIKK